MQLFSDNYKTKPVQLGTKAEFDQHVKYRSKYSDICQIVGIGRSGKGGTKEYKTNVRPVSRLFEIIFISVPKNLQRRRYWDTV